METRSQNLVQRGYDARLRTAPGSSRGVHWLALLTSAATFPLIFMGGLVTSHHAGMSVPDWPNSYHYNMFLFPPSHWVGGILYEHTHRLMATVVGMLSILLVVWAWRGEIIDAGLRLINRISPSFVAAIPATSLPAREPHRYLAVAVLAAVIVQGLLGGLRVVLVNLDLAIVHACVAQAFFCLTAYSALVTSKWWEDSKPDNRKRRRSLRYSEEPDFSLSDPVLGDTSQTGVTVLRPQFIVLGIVTVVAIYLQLIVGATMRHFDAGLAIPDLPLAYGKLLPPMSAQSLASINHLRGFQLNLDPVTLLQIWLHFGHRVGAVLVSVLVLTLSIRVLLSRNAALLILAILLILLLCAQVTLGVLTVMLRKPADIASAHVAVGALVLVTAFVLTAALTRVSRFSIKNAASKDFAPPGGNLSGTFSPVLGGER